MKPSHHLPPLRAHAFAAALALSFAVQCVPQLVAQATPATVELTGHRRTIDGVEVLFLRGTDYERGFAEGYLMAAETARGFRSLLASGMVPGGAAGWNVGVLPKVRTGMTFPERVQERCRGLLDGVAARDVDLLEIPELRRDLTVDDLLGVAAIPDIAGLACSSFAAFGARTATGAPVVGRNLDYFSTPELLQQTMVKVHAPAEGRAGFVEIGWPGSVGVLTAVSERGVAVAVHDVFMKLRGERRVTPRPLVLQEIVERLGPAADAAEQAVRIAHGYRVGMGGNVMLAWAGDAPGAVVLEIDTRSTAEHEFTIREPQDGADWIACTNHHRLPSQGNGASQHPRCWRYDRLERALTGGDSSVLDVAAAWRTIGLPQVDTTLYQCVADLGTGSFGVRMRRGEAEDAWDRADGLDIRALIGEAERGGVAAAGDGGR
ncbi:MAG: hypothetical protein IPM29_27515 [Planctomycetes bacterium]|nr:hypothetical protein [Planctomycetota bacterium]